jgi:uroporphyrinogen-III decarboxylase
MLFGAARWREMFKPHVKRLIALCHSYHLPAIYHGCGNAREIFDDMVEMGLDAYNPLEAKSGLDVVELKKMYSNRLAFVGNIDVRALATNDRAAIKREVLYKLRAAQGGGYVAQSDHSIPGDVAPSSYEYVIELLQENGRLPILIS